MSAGTKVTATEKRRYEMLRGNGFSPQAAAESIGRSKSWGYSYERHKREREPVTRTRPRERPTLSRNLAEAVELIVALMRDDDAKVDRLLTTYSTQIVFSVARVALFLATKQAGDLQRDLTDLFEGEPMENELRVKPLSAEEILGIIPDVLDRHYRGEDVTADWEPARIVDMLSRYREANPWTKDIENEEGPE